MGRTFIIAEAGVNHNGSIQMAIKMVDAALDAGADAIKFQAFAAERLVTRSAPKASYQKRTTNARESQFEMLKRVEISPQDHKKLFGYCRKKGITFISSPFDPESIALLNELGLEIFKIPSGEITNLPYLRYLGSLKKRVILSTGMSDLGEIEDALDILTAAGTKRDRITLLHCTSEYPAAYKDVNLMAMVSIREAFKIPVGYSDHTPGIEVPVAAVALGATVIEKHFTLSRDLSGPDHTSSLEPAHFRIMVEAVRNTEAALGNGIKTPSPSELRTSLVVRKSIVARRRIAKGEQFTPSNLTTKRPGTGVNPMAWDEVLGQRARRDYAPDDPVER